MSSILDKIREMEESDPRRYFRPSIQATEFDKYGCPIDPLINQPDDTQYTEETYEPLPKREVMSLALKTLQDEINELSQRLSELMAQRERITKELERL